MKNDPFDFNTFKAVTSLIDDPSILCRRECRPMSRYVYEVQPYHSVRELEMDRIMKAKYQKKFFAKRDKKPEEAAVAKKTETRSCKLDVLSVPEAEPFRRAFAVNGFKNDNDKEMAVDKPVRRVDLVQVRNHIQI